MKTSTGKPTKAQQARFKALREIGCICCWNYLGRYVVPEIHHIVKGMKRLGHDYTLPLCPAHHRGVIEAGCHDVYGPSLAHGKRTFEAVFGTEAQLLETVNAMLERRNG